MNILSGDKIPSKRNQFILFVEKGKKVSVPDPDLQSAAEEAIDNKIFCGNEDEILPLIRTDRIFILVGLGQNADALSMRKLSSLTKSALQTKPLSLKRPIALIPHLDEERVIRAVVDGTLLGLYRWDKYISKPNEEQETPHKLDLFIQTSNSEWVNRYTAICEGVNFARNLGNENAQTVTTDFLEQTVRDLVKGRKNCKLEVLGRKELEKKGFGLHLAVCQGSQQEPKLLILTYRGGKKKDPFIALVGKGITFDTGGLNLKPTNSIEAMRMDMCGAAAVIGTLQNTLKLKIPCNVYFVCGLAENAIGPKSYRPGDVFVSYSGKSVEIANTDAEGRLVLGDANSYMARNYKPEAIIDIATLTGAVVVALGYEYTGLMSTDAPLAQDLLRAAEISDDRAWQLPIYPELREHVKSKIADIKNIGENRCAGSLSAGEFLRQFAQCDSEEQKWAHLDIAGTAKPQKEIGYLNSNASGSGVRLLTQYLLNRAG